MTACSRATQTRAPTYYIASLSRTRSRHSAIPPPPPICPPLPLDKCDKSRRLAAYIRARPHDKTRRDARQGCVAHPEKGSKNHGIAYQTATPCPSTCALFLGLSLGVVNHSTWDCLPGAVAQRVPINARCRSTAMPWSFFLPLGELEETWDKHCTMPTPCCRHRRFESLCCMHSTAEFENKERCVPVLLNPSSCTIGALTTHIRIRSALPCER